jgi:DNA invertase Pin-like site-specific DNA recombinase
MIGGPKRRNKNKSHFSAFSGRSFLTSMLVVVLFFLKYKVQNELTPMARKRNLVQAIGYVRTSSAANVGRDKDSEPRQRRAIERYAKSAGFDVVDWFDDPAVSGSDPIETRPGFAALLNRIEGDGVRVVLVEDASRFARDLMAQELGLGLLIKLGMRVLTANGDDMTVTDDPMKVAYRQIAGAFSQLEKARLVAKLKAARVRQRAANGKCEGRKSYAEAMPETVALAKELHASGLSYRKISADLAARGHVTGSGKPHVASAIQKMLGR